MEKNEVAKPSAVIQISNKITLFQRRAWNILLANAFYDLKDLNNRRFKISFRTLCEKLGYKHTDKKYSEVDRMLYQLVDYSIQWNILGKDGKETRGAASLLAGFEIKNGMCVYDYSALLQEKLANPYIFARINLSIQNRFNSKHSLALYELFADYRGIGQTPWIIISDFRNLMGLDDNKYTRFKDIKNYIINKALKEINDKSDIIVKVDMQREKRQVIAVKFIISDNPDYQPSLDLILPPSQEEAQEIYDNSTKIVDSFIVNNDLLDQLVRFGIPEIKARKAIQDDETSVRMALMAAEEYVKRSEKSGNPIRNISAVVQKAISEGWNSKSQAQIDKEEGNKLRKEKEEKEAEEKRKKEKLGDKMREFEIIRRKEALKIYKLLPEKEKKVIFNRIFKEVSDFEKTRIEDKKEEAFSFQIKLVKVLAPLLSPEFQQFEAWKERSDTAGIVR